MPVLKIKTDGVWEDIAGSSGLVNVDADTLDGKHASEFASASDVDNLKFQIGDVTVAEQIANAVGAINIPVTSVNGQTGAVELTAFDVDALPSTTVIPSIDGLATEIYVDNKVAGKVDKVDGMGLSSNDFTTAEKEKLANLDAEAVKITVDSELSSTSANPVQNKIVTSEINGLKALVGDTAVSTQISNAINAIEYPVKSVNGKTGTVTLTAADVGALSADTTIPSISGLATEIYVDNKVSNKVDKVDGKDLSTNDYTTIEKDKLAGIETGANNTIVDSVLSSTSTNPVQNNVINTAISNLSALIGDTSVSEQITSAIEGVSQGKTLAQHLAEENMVLTSLQYGDTLPDPGTPGRIFFKKVSS